MNLPIKIVTRSSPLALAQIDEIIRDMNARDRFFKADILKMRSTGDKDKITPLTESRDDFFTDTLDRALLKGQADIAIHSAKDLPQNLHPDLKIFALTHGLESQDAWVGRLHWKDLPAKSKVGTSSILRQQQILQLRPDVKIVNIRGTINERIELVQSSKVDGIVVAVCALRRLGMESLIKDIFPWEGMPLQGQLAIVGRRGEHELEKFFSILDVRKHYGKVTLVGAGPGDPELITLKGINALKEADCVFYDYLVDEQILQHAPNAEHIYAGKRKGDHSLSQEDLSRMLRDKAFAGKNVVRLKGGDPLIFGRGADEIQFLRSYHIEVPVIPGISSATGIPSSLGVPLTARGVSSSVAFLSGHAEDENKRNPSLIKIPQAETLVFLMGLTKLKTIIKSLQRSKWPQTTPVMIIANGTKTQEQILNGTISTIEKLVKKQRLKPPALIITGKTIDFYRPKPEKTLLHCGTHPDLYKHLGRIIPWPMIEIKEVSMDQDQERKLSQVFESSEIIVCTSWYAGEYLIDSLRRIKPKIKFEDKTFAVIGQRTQRSLEKYGIKAAIVAEEETAEGLLKEMLEHIQLKDKRILFPRSSLPNPFLKDALIALGAVVTEITIYENTKPAKRPLPSVNLDGVIFTSPSTVRNFIEDYGTIPDSWQILAKGPVTLKTLQEAGYKNATSLS